MDKVNEEVLVKVELMDRVLGHAKSIIIQYQTLDLDCGADFEELRRLYPDCRFIALT